MKVVLPDPQDCHRWLVAWRTMCRQQRLSLKQLESRVSRTEHVILEYSRPVGMVTIRREGIRQAKSIGVAVTCDFSPQVGEVSSDMHNLCSLACKRFVIPFLIGRIGECAELQT